ncbi:serine hydrolase [Spirosoma flavum]|uniref:Serine hydrolase n=1 Tax=Spirosoma flavum TaxID=2048557 RepID=A0ABW6AH54_9BACT
MHKLLVTAFFLLVHPVTFAQPVTYSKTVLAKINQVENHLAGDIRTPDDKDGNLQQRMTYFDVPGLSIAVIHNYQIEWVKAYGWADTSSHRPVTHGTRFQAGSISKSLNSVGVLRLVQDKRIDLYADINQYLTSWQFPYDSVAKGKKISVAHLLSHTAGLTVHGFPGYASHDPIPTLKQILDGQLPANTKAVRSHLAPGLIFDYSGGGTTISQVLLMDVTHQPYEEYMWERVLKPMGMIHSSYKQPPAQNTLLATGYDNTGNEVLGKYHIYPEQAAAGLWTTPTDLGRYIIETQLAYQGKSSKVLSQQTTRLRLTPYVDSSAALGVFIKQKGAERYFTHDGSDAGFRATYYGSLNSGNGVVIMVNSDNGDILPEIVNSVARVYNWKGFYQPTTKLTVSVQESILDTYVGDYEATEFLAFPTVIFSITREGNRLFQTIKGFFKWELFPETKTKFFLKSTPATVDFINDDSGRVVKQVFTFGGEKTEALRIR